MARNNIKISDNKWKEDMINQLPNSLIYEILVRLSTKEAVTTSILSRRWRNHWKSVPGLDLNLENLSSSNVIVSFADRFFETHRNLWIRKLRLSIHVSKDNAKSNFSSWIDLAIKQRIQHLDLHFEYNFNVDAIQIPLSLYTCETLVYLRLCGVSLVNIGFVSLPCLKIISLEYIKDRKDAILEKFISHSPVLEDITIMSYFSDKSKILKLRSQTVRRINIDSNTRVVIDAPLLECLKTQIYSIKNYEIISLDFPNTLDVHVSCCCNFIHEFLNDFSRVKDLTINNFLWKDIPVYMALRYLRYFRNLSCLNAQFSKNDLEMLPTILERCTILKSLTLDIINDYRHKKEPNIMFSRVPYCLVASLKFVELKRGITKFEGEMKLIKYFLKNSRILEKFKLDAYYTQKTKCDILEILLAMTRRSNNCQVIVV